MKSSQSNTQFGEALRQARQDLQLSQVQVCDLAGVGPAFLYELEHGKPTVRLDKVLAVLNVLGLGLELREANQSLTVNMDQGQ